VTGEKSPKTQRNGSAAGLRQASSGRTATGAARLRASLAAGGSQSISTRPRRCSRSPVSKSTNSRAARGSGEQVAQGVEEPVAPEVGHGQHAASSLHEARQAARCEMSTPPFSPLEPAVATKKVSARAIWARTSGASKAIASAGRRGGRGLDRAGLDVLRAVAEALQHLSASALPRRRRDHAVDAVAATGREVQPNAPNGRPGRELVPARLARARQAHGPSAWSGRGSEMKPGSPVSTVATGQPSASTVATNR
jgi:hypothetical protein